MFLIAINVFVILLFYFTVFIILFHIGTNTTNTSYEKVLIWLVNNNLEFQY